MYIIKVTSKDGLSRFIYEQYPYHDEGLLLTDNMDKATRYGSILEFRVAWKKWKIVNPWGLNKSDTLFFNKDVVKVEAINFDVNNFSMQEINMKEKGFEPFKPDELYFEQNEFDALKHCMWGSSHWLYGDDDWIAFPKDEDYKRVTKIRYFKRGLTAIISATFPYRNLKIGINPIPSCYRSYNRHFRAGLTTHPTILKVYLSDYGECDYFTCLPL